MPPRYAYWTIIVDGQPTAFRAAAQEDLLPTFKRLKERHPSAVMQWFQNGKLWPSRVDAQEAMRARGEMGRRGDERQRGGFRDRKRENTREKLDWKPKGEFTPAPRRPEKPEWKPKGSFDRDRKPEWRPKFQKSEAEGRGPRRSAKREGGLDWTPKPQAPGPKPREKRAWIPKAEYKKSQGIEAPRDSKWRPGGEHRDPKQKYKDAKKAKWTKFKKTIRTRWETKKKKTGE
ncbi:MAG: hypothetical protein K2Y23_01600 [Cyanobacteria bacterium]|nr:hypothetical protein [Cyanobacteriota bacterium]